MNLIKHISFGLVLLVGLGVNAQKYTNTETEVVTKEWNGNTFSSSKSFFENISESSKFSMLTKALKNEKLRKAIEDEEMVTIFAISDTGFSKLLAKQDSIFDSSHTSKLASIIKFHIVPGRVDSYSLLKAVNKKGSTVYFSTLTDEKLGIKSVNNQLFLIDTKGNTSLISATDFYHKNGFFHIVDGIVLPETKK